MSRDTAVYPSVDAKCPKPKCDGKLVMDTLIGSVTCLKCGGRWRGKELSIDETKKEAKKSK